MDCNTANYYDVIVQIDIIIVHVVNEHNVIDLDEPICCVKESTVMSNGSLL